MPAVCVHSDRCPCEPVPSVFLVVPAAGQGSRMGGNNNKPFIELMGVPVIVRTLRVLADCPCVRGIFVVAKAEEIPAMEALLENWPITPEPGQPITLPIKIIPGGAQRQDSVYAGILAVADHLRLNPNVSDQDPIIAIHDGARCLVTKEIVCRTIRHAVSAAPCAAAIPVKDTIKMTNPAGRVQGTLDRSVLQAIQTPQVARLSLFLPAFSLAQKNGFVATDDLSVLEAAGIAVDVVAGDERNIKLTTPFDLRIARAILSDEGSAVIQSGAVNRHEA